MWWEGSWLVQLSAMSWNASSGKDVPTTSDDAREENTGDMDVELLEGDEGGPSDQRPCGARSEALSLDLIVDLVVSHLLSPRDLLSASQTCSRFRSAVRRVEARRTILRGACATDTVMFFLHWVDVFKPTGTNQPPPTPPTGGTSKSVTSRRSTGTVTDRRGSHRPWGVAMTLLKSSAENDFFS